MSEENIEMFRLVSGEYIIAERIGEVDEAGIEVLYKNPITLITMPPQQGQKEQMFGFAPFPHFAQPGGDEITLTFNRVNIVCWFAPDPQFLDQYKTIFNKILTPSSKLIIGK